MQMMIYIDEKLYNDITTEGLYYSRAYEMGKAIENGVILPKGHGGLINAREAYDRISEQGDGNYIDMDLVGKGLDETQTVIETDKE